MKATIAPASEFTALEVATLAAQLYPNVHPGRGETRAGIAVTTALNLLELVEEAALKKPEKVRVLPPGQVGE